VRKVLARHGSDWRQRLTDDERLEHNGLEQRLDEARQIHDELMRVAMERRGTDDRWPDED